jgi:RimJ/RimL family protein N-acetyltransferase
MPIERMQSQDWKRVRAIRRRALLDAPDAFGTTLAEHDAQSADVWRTRLAASSAATFVSARKACDVGLVTGAEFGDREAACGLFGLWVEAESRRGGLALELVEGVIRWARSAGYARMILEVADENRAAIRLYERCGFAPTGHRSTLAAPRTHIREHEHALEL